MIVWYIAGMVWYMPVWYSIVPGDEAHEGEGKPQRSEHVSD